MPLISEVGRKQRRVRILLGVITAILWLGVALHLFPVWWMFITSIKPSREVFVFPPTLWPKEPTFICYKMFFYLAQTWTVLQYPVYVYLKNSAIMTGAIMAIQIPITALIGYALSKMYNVKWNRIIFLFCIGTLMIPTQLSLVPGYLIMRHFPFPTMHVPNIPFTNVKFPSYRFLDTYWAVILPASYNAFNVLLFKGFFDGIPGELINAARLDGASEPSIFARIILPMSKPIFAVVAYFTFQTAWNNFMWPLIVIQKNELYPLSVMMYRFQNYMTSSRGLIVTNEATKRLLEQGIGFNGLMTLGIIESIPVFIMFLIFREQLMTGIKLRGFK